MVGARVRRPWRSMRELAGQYPRYGYRKIRICLARRGPTMRAERTYRLWRQAGLHVPRRRPRRQVATRRPRPQPPTARNHVWAYDFVFDTCADGRSLKCLTSVDEFHAGPQARLAGTVQTPARADAGRALRRGRSRSACIVNGRLRYTGEGAVRRAPPCVVSHVGFYVLQTSSKRASAVRRTRPAECTDGWPR